jgi:hypothetical protein
MLNKDQAVIYGYIQRLNDRNVKPEAWPKMVNFGGKMIKAAFDFKNPLDYLNWIVLTQLALSYFGWQLGRELGSAIAPSIIRTSAEIPVEIAESIANVVDPKKEPISPEDLKDALAIINYETAQRLAKKKKQEPKFEI